MISSSTLNLDDNVLELDFGMAPLLDAMLTIDCTKLRLFSAAGDLASAYPLSNPATVENNIVSCPLGNALKIEIETNSAFGTSPTDTVLYTEAATGILAATVELVEDTAGQAVSTVNADDTPPRLQSFVEFDLDSGMITLSFTEPVNVDSFAFDQLTVENDFQSTASESFQLTGATCTQDVNCASGDLVSFALRQEDLNSIKLIPGLCEGTTDCVPKFTSNFVEDFATIPVDAYDPVNSNQFQLIDFTADTTGAILDDFDLNLSLDELTLVFNEPVSVDSFNPGQIVLQSSVDGGTSVLLTTESVPQGGDATTLVISLNRDADSVKIASLASSENTTYLYLSMDAITDLYGNKVNAILSAAAKQVRNLTDDATAPVLSSFVLDLDSNELVLTFSEPVLIDVLNTSFFTLSNSETAPTEEINLSQSAVAVGTENKTAFVSINIDGDSLTTIKTSAAIGGSVSDTFLTVAATAFEDTSNNANSLYSLSGTVVADDTRATLVNFGINMDLGQISLTFNDVVDVSSSRIRRTVSLQRAESDNVPYDLEAFYTRNDILGNDSTVVVIQLAEEDITALKATLDLVMNIDDSYITIEAETFNDIRGEDIIAVTNDNAIIASTYIPDSTPPILELFDFDLDSGNLVLFFDEPIDVNSFVFNRFVIQQNQTNGSESVSLSDGTLSSSNQLTQITLVLSRTDLNSIKTNTAISTLSPAGNTFLQLLQGALNDTSGNEISATFVNETFSAIEVGQFTDDTTPPAVESFILDLNKGEIALAFEEAVNVTTLQVSLLTLQSSSATDGSASEITITAATTTPQTNGASFTLALTSNDQNLIKLDPEIGVATSTYLRASADIVVDMAGVSAQDQAPIIATDVIADITAPRLDRFVLDLDSDTLELTFNEPVNVSTLQPTQFTLYSTSVITMGVNIPLDGSSLSTNGVRVSVSLPVDVALGIKNNVDIGEGSSNTFINFLTDSIEDLAGNGILTRPDALQASQVIQDTTGPVIDSFDLDMDTGVLTLHFPEPVDPVTFDGRFITIQDNVTRSEFYTLTGGVVQETDASSNVTIQLLTTDINELKVITLLATSENNTYLVIDAAALMDTFGNELTPVVDSEAIKVSIYTEDVSPPEVDTFELRNAANGVDVYLVVVFSETINASTVDPMSFTLLQAPSSAVMYTLTGGNVTLIDSTEIVILFTRTDLNAIKALYPLGSTVNNTYLSAVANAGTDMVGFTSGEVLVADAKQARNITADLIPPSLDSFVLDVDSGTLFLTFQEDVNPSTFNNSLVLLQSGENDASNNLTVSDSNVTSTDVGPVIEIALSDDNLNAIKVNTNLGTVVGNTYLSFAPGIVQDPAENLAFGIDSLSAHQAANFVSDTTQVNLLFFDLDMDDGTLLLEFDEAVDVSTLNLDQIEIQNDASNPSFIERLTDIAATFPPRTDGDGPIVTIPIPVQDLVNLQTTTTIAVSNTTTFLVILNFAIVDMNGNRVVRIPNIQALPVRKFTPDKTPPTVTGFHMDLHNSRIFLTFSEALQSVQSVTSDYITILAGPSSNSTRAITSAAEIRNNARNQLLINFENIEFYEIVLLNFCKSVNDCYVSLNPGTVTDYVNLPNDAITQDNPFMVTQFTADARRPILSEFKEFNLRDGYLVLQFNEPMDVSNFNPSLLQLATLYTDPFSKLTLSSAIAEATDDYYTTIRVNLTATEVDNIKLAEYVCSRRYNCYVRFLSTSVITDISGNLVDASKIGNNTGDDPVTLFILDVDQPILEDFTLNLNTDTLTLTFDEVVSYESLDPTALAVQSAADGTLESTTVYTLTGGMSMGPNGLEIEIVLSTDDICAIKGDDTLATEAGNTFIYFNETLLTDLAHESVSVLAVPISNGYPVTSYVNDTSSPSITEFQLNLNDDRILLTFDEPVRTSTLTNISLFTLHTGEEPIPMQSVTLAGGTVATKAEGVKVIMVMLLDEDVTSLKLNNLLATNTLTTYLSVGAKAIEDMAGNMMEAMTYVRATAFVPDETRPQLISFSLDMNIGLLNLTFDDVMLANTFDPAAFRVQNFIRATNDIHFTLLSSNTTDSDGYTFTVQFTDEDFLGIKSVAGLARSKDTSWLTMQAFAMDDVEGIDVLAITDGKAIQVTNYTTDDVPPQLSSFTLDLDTGTLNLTFNDFINETTLNIGDITIQNDSSSISPSVLTLTDGEVTVSSDGRTAVVWLSSNDLNQLKADPLFGTEVNNTYVAIAENAIEDLFGNLFSPAIPLNAARRASQVTLDETPIVLDSFNLDVNSGELSLTFDETYSFSSFNVTAITFQGASNASDLTSSFTLTEAESVSFNSLTTVDVVLTMSDLNELKVRRDVASDHGNTYLSVTSLLVEDVSGNPSFEITEEAGKRVSTFTRDSTPPALANYTVDINRGQIYFTFDEVIDPFTLTLSVLVLQNLASSPTETYTLTGDISDSETPSLSLNVSFNEEELNAVKGIRDLFVSPNTAFISFPAEFVSDMAGNPVTAESGVKAISFVFDTTPPQLLMYTLDMDEGLLIFNFSEIVDASTLNLSQFVLHNHRNFSLSTASVVLEHTTVTTNSASYAIEIAREDINYLKLNTSLATELSNTYLTFNNGSVADMVGNDIIGEEGKVPSEFIADATGPELSGFILDFGLGRVELTYSEPVNIDTFVVTAYTLLNASMAEGISSFTFTQDSSAIGSNGDVIYIEIGIQDLNDIKRFRDLATKLEDTFLSVISTGVQDMVGNPIQQRPPENAVQVTDLLPDEVGPFLRDFVLDLDDGELQLTFSETANSSSIDLTLFTIQNQIEKSYCDSTSHSRYISRHK